jgi:hypothetical protein
MFRIFKIVYFSKKFLTLIVDFEHLALSGYIKSIKLSENEADFLFVETELLNNNNTSDSLNQMPERKHSLKQKSNRGVMSSVMKTQHRSFRITRNYRQKHDFQESDFKISCFFFDIMRSIK